ncbi:hypothetical protein [Microcoleus sp. FACHB-672]|uniref:hypothetical protein n=1 Tax=Microcoleus sp. FACHB-672 TaxID=2692825 RepID=UPI001684459D|nr:hypothetical protein [Microcoleus sp. FACHB-672]MBD2043744.1 hypothetical protein [Microcoleus sp. FACHB-672]
MRESRLAIKRMPGSLWPSLAKMPAESLQQEAQQIADVFERQALKRCRLRYLQLQAFIDIENSSFSVQHNY